MTPTRFSITIRITGTYNQTSREEDIDKELRIISDVAVDMMQDNLYGAVDNIKRDITVYVEGWKRDKDIP